MLRHSRSTTSGTKWLRPLGILFITAGQHQYQFVTAVTRASLDVDHYSHFHNWGQHQVKQQQVELVDRRVSLDHEHGQILAVPPNPYSTSSPWHESFHGPLLYLNDRGQTESASKILERRFRYVFGPQILLQQAKKRRRKNGDLKWWIQPEPFYPSVARRLDNANDDTNTDDKYKYTDDDYNNYNDDKTNDDANNDDGKTKSNDDLVSAADERCSEFLVSFLEGTTDAHDTCEGMMNAYTAAGKS